MRRLLLLCLIAFTSLAALTQPASATPRAKRWTQILRSAGGSITVPPEWDGIWSSVDSVYACEGEFQGLETYVDTLCAGQVFGYEESGDPGITFDCSGSATATTVTVSCSGSSEIVEDCTVTISNSFEATRTGENYIATAISSIDYAGLAPGWNLRRSSTARRRPDLPPGGNLRLGTDSDPRTTNIRSQSEPAPPRRRGRFVFWLSC